nr:PREDICTED: putative gustatory receptor clone PTE03 [Latimeria chalumnae]|eukprot:XP_006011597.1 PREDICTED: putative gustatory receptor clone PTE03 [Latimeria chalumnae]
MANESLTSTFTITAYGEMDNFKYLYVYFALLGYLIIIFLNVTLFVVIVLEQSLHEPMYIFIGILALNGLYGGMTFFPKLIVDLLSEKQTISHVACLFQVFFIHTFVTFEFSILTVMAYDRYVAICNPLRYADIMNNSTICKLLAAAWGLPTCITAMNVILTMRLTLCGSIIEKPYCQIWSVLKLSCVDASINYDFDNFVTMVLGAIPTVLILISYFFIIKTSVQASKEARGKALQTCTPHLLTLGNFIIGVVFEVSQRHFDTSKFPISFQNFICIEPLIMPSLINPVIYGLRIKEINLKLKKRFAKTTKVSTFI